MTRPRFADIVTLKSGFLLMIQRLYVYAAIRRPDCCGWFKLAVCAKLRIYVSACADELSIVKI